MSNRMLIDAGHPEETRVVVLRGQQVEDFDFESENKLPLRGNIYLAQITRVEPSLQAAFVEYGGNRHGFLAFSEIHPDYYQIPVSDREELLRKHAEEDRKTAKQEDNEVNQKGGENSDAESADAPVENIGGDAHEEASASGRTRNLTRNYKIQEVIKRRQVILIQVVKEERGNKGAALTTYLSLAGRYCVLMPNTARGGGISRKINTASDRHKLKKIVEKLDVSEGMGLIIRTAGAQRTGTEIKRDYQYLLRMWEKIRALTMESSAPSLVYEEGSLIKRSIRDLYDKDFDEIIVQGDEGYKDARDYMKMLMPSHARKVKPYKGETPLYLESGIESQLAAMFNPVANLPSGGYLVINQTEALVAIDVNSGKSTKEHSIEKTALNTNLEAAQEVARQARLRDLAGLLVIDFIDMDENRNNRAVERKLKEALKNDRARIQVGKISPFGLMEMSRQRMRSGILEGSSINCEHCNGTGMVRSVESRALHVLRLVEEEALKRGQGAEIFINVPVAVAGYILNQKRAHLTTIEEHFTVSVTINGDVSLNAMQMTIDQVNNAGQSVIVRMDGDPENTTYEDESGNKKRRRRRRNTNKNENQTSEAEAEATTSETSDHPAGEAADDSEEKPRRRRRGRRGGRRRRRPEEASAETTSNEASGNETASPPEASANKNADKKVIAPNLVTTDTNESVPVMNEVVEKQTKEKPKKRPGRRKKSEVEAEAKPSEAKTKPSKKKQTPAVQAEIKAEEEIPSKKPAKRQGRKSKAEKEAESVAVEPQASKASKKSSTADDANTPKRTGWWSR